MSDGFLGRWSRRKIDAKEGRPLEEPLPPAVPAEAAPQPQGAPAPVMAQAPEGAELPPPPTLDEAQSLTSASDFRPFMARNVPPDVKNAAMKKLFADPRYGFEAMDRMDIYIDDYSKPDPLPAAMARQLASAKFLKLFDEEEEKRPADPEGGDRADAAAPQDVAQSGLCNDLPSQPESAELHASPEHADPDLRLQQDDAPPGEKPGGGAG